MEQTVFDNILDWAHKRNLIDESNPHAQMLKMTEEVGELAAAIARNDKPEALLAIGDCIIVLTILAAQLGWWDVESGIVDAYNEITDRKGRMENGVFIREETAC